MSVHLPEPKVCLIPLNIRRLKLRNIAREKGNFKMKATIRDTHERNIKCCYF